MLANKCERVCVRAVRHACGWVGGCVRACVRASERQCMHERVHLHAGIYVHGCVRASHTRPSAGTPRTHEHTTHAGNVTHEHARKRTSRTKMHIATDTSDLCTSIFLKKLFGACRRRTLRTRVDLKVTKDAPDRDLSDAAFRFDIALGIRHVPQS